MPEISEAEARELIALPKFAKSGLWTQRQNHAGHAVWFAELFDESDATVPGVSIALEVKEAAPVDTCFFLFTLFQRRGTGKLRAYQLEVVHAQKRSHNGPDGPLYGPHEHICEAVTTPVADAVVRCDNWSGSLSFFAERAGVTFLMPVESPC